MEIPFPLTNIHSFPVMDVNMITNPKAAAEPTKTISYGDFFSPALRFSITARALGRLICGNTHIQTDWSIWQDDWQRFQLIKIKWNSITADNRLCWRSQSYFSGNLCHHLNFATMVVEMDHHHHHRQHHIQIAFLSSFASECMYLILVEDGQQMSESVYIRQFLKSV